MTSLFTRVELAACQRLLHPILFRWAGGDPETIHEAMISQLGHVPATRSAQVVNSITIAGIEFLNRVKVAAGLDKDRVAAMAWAQFGFDHTELGTVTEQAQPDNPKPWVFGARASWGVINRIGFNNHGADALADRLLKLKVQRGNHRLGIPFGVSIGKAKTIALVGAASDYLTPLDTLRDHADYFAVNVSSPNTPGLRSLQVAKELEQLLGCIVESVSQGAGPIPVFVKLAPNLEPGQLAKTVAVIHDCDAAGIITTNTALSRESLVADDRHLADKGGGLSGAPLITRTLASVERVVFATDLPVIGVRGIMSPCDGMRMFEAGAVLLQIYMGFIYAGPALVRGLNDLLRCA